MRTIIITMLLVGMPLGQTVVFAAEGPILRAALREVSRLTQTESAHAIQPATTEKRRSGGHPVLIGAAVGAGTGALLGALGTSCSAAPSPVDPAPCGTRLRLGGAILGAGVGAGLGALVGVTIKAITR